jgi:hypothetical protein
MAYNHDNLQEIIGTLTKQELKDSIPANTIADRCYASWRQLSAAVFCLSDEAKNLIRQASIAKLAAASSRESVKSRLKRKRDYEVQRNEREARRGAG